MDKNTLTGILLMGAIILGFMFLNKPSAEEQERQRQAAQEQAEAERQQALEAAGVVAPGDTLSFADLADIRSTVKSLGTTDSATRVTVLDLGTTRLALGPDDSLSGTADGLEIADLTASPRPVDSRSRQAVRELRKSLAGASRYRGFVASMDSADSTTVALANNLLKLEITNKGGMIARAELADYQSYDSTAVKLMDRGTNSYSFTFTTANQRIDTRELTFTPVQEGDTAVVMMLNLAGGARFGIRYTLLPDSYLVRMSLLQENMERVVPANSVQLDFAWEQLMPRNEAGRVFEERNSALYWMYLNGDVKNLSEGKDAAKEVNERFRWVGYKNQFFSSILVAEECFQEATFDSQMLETPDFIKRMTTRSSIAYSPRETNPANFTWFLGPNSYPLMHSIQDGEVYPEANMNFTKVIPLGWPMFRWINTLIVIPVFSFLGSFISNYGIIILLLTLFIKLILFPFTYKSLKAQARMRLLQPEMKKINEKYPGQENAMKRQQETMALYSRSGASPFSGCLPMLLQMPILIAMFSFFPSAIELRGKSFLWAKDLSAPDAILSWNADIPFISSTFGNHLSLFCLLMTVTNILYTRTTMQSQPTAEGTPNMKWMMYLMPLMFLFIFNNYAAGLSYYYFLSLLITIIMTWAFRHTVSEEKMRAEMAARANKPRKKSGFMARLEEAQRRQQAMMREQQAQQSGGKRRR